MKLTKRAEYGLIALLDLAACPEHDVMQVSRIARRHGISVRFLENIMLDLRRAGFVESQRGRSGGYALARRPEEMTLGEVVRALDESGAPAHGGSAVAEDRVAAWQPPYLGDGDDGSSWLMLRTLRAAVSDALDGISMADLLRGRAAPS